MTVGLLLIAHDELAGVLLDTATATLGTCPMNVQVLSVNRDVDPEALVARGRAQVEELDQGNGVLVLTDMYGSTPSNIACRLRESGKVRVVAGLNLPMLIRVLNYPALELEVLADKAVSGGRDGVVSCSMFNHNGNPHD